MFRRNQSGDVTRTSANPLCYYAVSFRTNTERLRSHHFILLSITADSSATSDYVVVPERFGQNEEPAKRNEERAKKKPSLVPSSVFNQCIMKTHVNMNFIDNFFNIFYVFYLFLVHFLEISPHGKTFLSFVNVIRYCAGAEITTLMSISDGLDPYIFLSKDGKDVVYERRNGRRGVYCPPESAFFLHGYCE